MAKRGPDRKPVKRPDYSRVRERILSSLEKKLDQAKTFPEIKKIEGGIEAAVEKGAIIPAEARWLLEPITIKRREFERPLAEEIGKAFSLNEFGALEKRIKFGLDHGTIRQSVAQGLLGTLAKRRKNYGQALEDRLESASSIAAFREVEAEIRTALENKAITGDTAKSLKKRLKERKDARSAQIVETDRKAREQAPGGRPPLRRRKRVQGRYERSRVFAVKPERLEKMTGKELTNRAYANYLQGTGFEQLFRVFSQAGPHQAYRHRRRKIFDPEPPKPEPRSWKTFHVGMDQAIPRFGEENLKALGKRLDWLKTPTGAFSVDLLDFTPRADHIYLRLELPFSEEGVWKRRRTKVSIKITEMEEGKITKIEDLSKSGNSLIYRFGPQWVIDTLHGKIRRW